MKPVCRIGDIGTGYCENHKSNVTITMLEGCSKVFADGIAVCTVTHKGIASCGHEAIVTIGSANCSAEGKAILRVGDGGVLSAGGTFVMTSGSPNVDSD